MRGNGDKINGNTAAMGTDTTVIRGDGDRQHGNTARMGTVHLPEKITSVLFTDLQYRSNFFG